MKMAIAFSAVVGQEPMKRGLLLNAIDPAIGGILIRGERGTAKSTAVRALAALLPPLDVVAGCVYSCDPDDDVHRCDDCAARIAAGDVLRAERRAMRIVELPINASEDRLVGSIDMEVAIAVGEKRFAPGLLAAANRNILYVDEVNLLDDHLIDVLLDAAAMGRVTVEREGISVSYPSRFILVGTMNPDEGELRPQLLDRFGLCVDVAGLRRLEDRVNVLEVTGSAEAADDSELRDVIVAARDLVGLVTLDDEMRRLIASLCIDAGTLGHRADIVLARAARAHCAWREAERRGKEPPAEVLSVGVDDIAAVAELVLLHRRTERVAAPAPTPSATLSDQAGQRDKQLQQELAATAVQFGSESKEDSTPSADTPHDTEQSSGGESQSPAAGSGQTTEGHAQPASDVFAVRKIALPRDRKTRTSGGKRSQSRSGDRRGRYVASTQVAHTTDVAFDATVRAAAPYQKQRQAEASGDYMALRVERQDLRQKIRRRKIGALIVFVVDASASMDAEQRMEATKGAVLSLLRDAYLRRDKVSLVVFSGRSARVALQPTSSVDLAEQRLQRLAVGGTTPLTHGLLAGLKVVRTERLRDASVVPLMVLISDGRGNISLLGEEPVVEAQRVAEQIGAEQIPLLVIDSARDHIPASRMPGGAFSLLPDYALNACRDLAERSGGEYLGLLDLSQAAILAGVRRTLKLRR